MTQTVFGKKTPPPSDRELHGQLLVAGRDIFEVVVQQVGTLRGLKQEYPDRWPEILDIAAIEEGVEGAGERLKMFLEWMAGNPGPMPPKAVELLAELVQMLQNTRTVIADNLADILMDKLAKNAIERSGSAIG